MYADLWLFIAFDRNTHQYDSAFTTQTAYTLRVKIIQIVYPLWPSRTMVTSLCLGRGIRRFGFGIRPHGRQDMC